MDSTRHRHLSIDDIQGNCVISAPSGSGKTVLCREVAYLNLSSGRLVFIIDREGEYRALPEQIPARTLQLSQCNAAHEAESFDSSASRLSVFDLRKAFEDQSGDPDVPCLEYFAGEVAARYAGSDVPVQGVVIVDGLVQPSKKAVSRQLTETFSALNDLGLQVVVAMQPSDGRLYYSRLLKQKAHTRIMLAPVGPDTFRGVGHKLGEADRKWLRSATRGFGLVVNDRRSSRFQLHAV